MAALAFAPEDLDRYAKFLLDRLISRQDPKVKIILEIPTVGVEFVASYPEDNKLCISRHPLGGADVAQPFVEIYADLNGEILPVLRRP